jgi:hypothetical protein
LFNILVQLVQIDIAEYGRNYTTLGASAYGWVIRPRFYISSFEKLPINRRNLLSWSFSRDMLMRT